MERTEDEYEEYLNEVLGEFTVGNLTFDGGKIIREMDPVAFRCGYADWTSQLEDEADD